MIVLTDIKKQYDGRVVLDIPHLEILPGKRYAILGANGSGKSTLLKILAGVLKPDSGTVTRAVPLKSSAYLPQIPYAFDMSVLQNVQLGTNGSKRMERALLAVEQVGLTAFLHANASRLSGGETQRMALARVLAGHFELLLLDEPTSATDISAGDLIEAALLQYGAETGCAMVLSTHAPSQAARLAESALFLENGRILEAGSVHELLHSPRQEGTKVFLQHWRI